MCRDDEEATWCIGRVRYYVKAIPLDEDGRAEHARSFGLQFTTPRRYAMCDVWPATRVGYGLDGGSGSPEWRELWRTAVDCMQRAGVVASEDAAKALMRRVVLGAALYKVKMKPSEAVRLGGAGGVAVIAVPLDQQYEGGEWEVRPMVSVHPKTSPMTVKNWGSAAKKALYASGKEYTFFTHTYGLSAL